MTQIPEWPVDFTVQRANDAKSVPRHDVIMNSELKWQCNYYCYGLTLIIACIGIHMRYKMWDEIIYPSPNFNGSIVEV